VSQETDVTDVAQHLTGHSKVETNAASTRQNPPRRSRCSALAQVLPALHQTLRNLLGGQGEDQMVPPITVDVQIARP
jgi:predicted secreted protein